MEGCEFESWLQQVSRGFVSLSDGQRNAVLDVLIASSGPTQLRHLSTQLESLLKRDFLRLLPLELSFHLLKWLDPRSLLTCCLVCRSWNKVVNGCSEVWLSACRELGWRVPDECSTQDGRHWKCAYIQANRRLRQLRKQQAFETSSLLGHSARVYALYYKDGLLCTGSDDLSAKLWDVKTGQCVYGIQTHTCADVKFDEHKLVTASFDNTLACWEWSTGKRTRHFRGHTAAVFSVDYRDELDILVSGSADFAVKIWSLSSAACLNTLTGHSEWVTKGNNPFAIVTAVRVSHRNSPQRKSTHACTQTHSTIPWENVWEWSECNDSAPSIHTVQGRVWRCVHGRLCRKRSRGCAFWHKDTPGKQANTPLHKVPTRRHTCSSEFPTCTAANALEWYVLGVHQRGDHREKKKLFVNCVVL
ncbi:F-box/WD repeat-containing protein 2 isoform X3 [Petromyzon marinus]|uniref:F-box/WD repeat-containing protein 2 isoform X3 n=1 Tax=Petromyzon marinus TaxID=7757 RepID=UPI003F6E6705